MEWIIIELSKPITPLGIFGAIAIHLTFRCLRWFYYATKNALTELKAEQKEMRIEK
tara:strand:- start:1194 stop:1361 length:168 start_codon:yes stop_codon:yes gene_type:complete